ncbi:hypothetical protein D3C87_1904830 [compost metagenome]
MPLALSAAIWAVDKEAKADVDNPEMAAELIAAISFVEKVAISAGSRTSIWSMLNTAI